MYSGFALKYGSFMSLSIAWRSSGLFLDVMTMDMSRTKLRFHTAVSPKKSFLAANSFNSAAEDPAVELNTAVLNQGLAPCLTRTSASAVVSV